MSSATGESCEFWRPTSRVCGLYLLIKSIMPTYAWSPDNPVPVIISTEVFDGCVPIPPDADDRTRVRLPKKLTEIKAPLENKPENAL